MVVHEMRKDHKSNLLYFLILTILAAAILFTGCEYEFESSSPYSETEESIGTEDTEAGIIGTEDTETLEDISEKTENEATEASSKNLHFRNNKLLEDHFRKHGIEMGFSSPEDYEKAAAAVVNSPSALHKTESEDGDDIYYIEETNEFVVVSTDGFIRTYFLPDAGIKYYNRQ